MGPLGSISALRPLAMCLSVKGKRNKLLKFFQRRQWESWERKGEGHLAGKAPKHPSANADSAPAIANVLPCDLGKS